MNPLFGYLITHWRGEQSLPRSFFINVVLVYLAMIASLVALGTVIHYAPAILIGLSLFLLVTSWSLVGVTRAAIYAISAPNGFGKKVFAVVLLIVVGIVVYTTVQDIWRLNLL